MADNYKILEPTSGTTVAGDEIGGIIYPRFKMCWGPDGAQQDASLSNPIPVGPAQSAAYEAIVEKLYSFFTTSYQSLALSNLASCRLLIVTNYTDAYIMLSFDAGTTTHVVVPPGTIRSVSTLYSATQVHAKYNNAAGLPTPSSGYAWFEVVR